MLSVVVCLLGRSRGWLVRCIRSGYGSHGLFSGRMRLAGSSLSMHGLLSGQSAMSGAWPWIGLGGPEEGLGASLIISLMLCNYITFQNCR